MSISSKTCLQLWKFVFGNEYIIIKQKNDLRYEKEDGKFTLKIASFVRIRKYSVVTTLAISFWKQLVLLLTGYNFLSSISIHIFCFNIFVGSIYNVHLILSQVFLITLYCQYLNGWEGR